MLILFICFLFFASPFLGRYIYNLFFEETPWLKPYLGWLETGCYRLIGEDPKKEMTAWEYGKALLFVNILGFFFLFALQLAQALLPLNPQNFGAVDPALAFNTAASFVTNTNWQSYAGESTLSYLTQMLGLTSQNFLSAATGIGALLVLLRGIIRNAVGTVGNFFCDMTRAIVYLLLPLSMLLAVALISQGVVQTFSPYIHVETLEHQEQIIPLGAVASQVAIKQLGTNGGGFFNANSAHPFENPTPLSNSLELFAILLIPCALAAGYGKMVDSRKDGWVLFSVMCILGLLSFCLAFFSDLYFPAPEFPGSSWEGKEVRFGNLSSLLWAISTTATANGSVNAMMSSLPPIPGGIALWNMKLGEMIFGGVGVGLAAMLMFVFLTVFLAGLMVGRSPEYLGKKIEKNEMRWVMLAILAPGLMTLLGSGIGCMTSHVLEQLGNKGPHGLTEIVYACASASVNNGSAFAGFNANTPLINGALGIFMLLGRMAIVFPSIAIGGLLAKKKATPPSSGTLSTHTFIFGCMLLGTILIVGGLTFFPSLSLGPILENYLMMEGKLF